MGLCILQLISKCMCTATHEGGYRCVYRCGVKVNTHRSCRETPIRESTSSHNAIIEIFPTPSTPSLVFGVSGMMCQAKTSYIETEIDWGARFEPCMTLEKGAFRVDLRRFHSTYPVPLLPCSAREAQQLQMTQPGLELPGSFKESGECVVDEDYQEEDVLQAQGSCFYTIENIQELNESDSH